MPYVDAEYGAEHVQIFNVDIDASGTHHHFFYCVAAYTFRSILSLAKPNDIAKNGWKLAGNVKISREMVKCITFEHG